MAGTMGRMLTAGVLLLGCLLTTGGEEYGDADFDVTIHDTPSNLLLETHTRVSQNVNDASGANLAAVTFEVQSPVGATLGFLAAVEGSAMVGEESTRLVSLDPAVSQGTSAPLTIEYPGDLRRFFPDGHTLVVRWHVHIDPSYPVPASGITVKCRIAVRYAR